MPPNKFEKERSCNPLFVHKVKMKYEDVLMKKLEKIKIIEV